MSEAEFSPETVGHRLARDNASFLQMAEQIRDQASAIEKYADALLKYADSVADVLKKFRAEYPTLAKASNPTVRTLVDLETSYRRLANSFRSCGMREIADGLQRIACNPIPLPLQSMTPAGSA